MKLTWIAGAILLLGLAGCGSDKSGSSDNALFSSQTLTYSLTENNCPTGEHSFATQGALCEGLRSAGLNNNCAFSLRKEKYEQDCGGIFTETN